MGKTFELTTDRLILRVPTLADAPVINAAMQEVWHDLQLWMSWAHDGCNSLESTYAYIQSIPEQMDSGGYPLFGFCRESGDFVVASGLVCEGDVLTTGYWVAQPYKGKGYATEAANACIRFAFQELGVSKLEINHFEGNEPSARVIQKLGFRFTHTAHKSFARCLDGAMVDVHHYAMHTIDQLPALTVRW